MFPLCDEGLVHQSQEVRKIKHAEGAPEMLIQASKKSVDLPFFCGHIVERIAGQMVELIQILVDCHAALSEGEEYALLDFHNPGGNMILAEMILEFSPSNFLVRGPYCFSIIPPYSGSSFKIMRCKGNLVSLFSVSNIQFPLNSP